MVEHAIDFLKFRAVSSCLGVPHNTLWFHFLLLNFSEERLSHICKLELFCFLFFCINILYLKTHFARENKFRILNQGSICFSRHHRLIYYIFNQLALCVSNWPWPPQLNYLDYSLASLVSSDADISLESKS